MRKLVIAFPYYSDDRAATMRLARFICALEPKYRDDVTLFFYARFDAVPITPSEMMKFVTTFPCEWGRSTTEVVGHPAGANAQARDFFEESARRVKDGRWADVDAVLICEPDCVPVAKGWIDQLRAEWDYAASVTTNLLCVGCRRSDGVDIPHFNGNSLWSPKLWDYADMRDRPGLGWDSALGVSLKIGESMDTPLISNLFRETNVPEERLRVNPFHQDKKTPPMLIHGIKDDSAIRYAEKMTGVPF